MSCPISGRIAIFIGCIFAIGCQPHKPCYRFDRGDSNYYVEHATEIAYPDVETALLDEVTQANAPITNLHANFDSFWDLSLEDSIAVALQNSKVIRGYGTPGLQGTRVAAGVDNLANGPGVASTIYSVSIRETEPGFIGLPGQLPNPGTINTNTGLDANQGVEAALAEFDAQLTSNVSWRKSDQPRNVTGAGLTFTPDVFQQDVVNWTNQIAKRSAGGTQFLFRNVNSYTTNSIPDTVQPLESVYETALEFEIRQPILRGRGEFINRMPIVISRINTDQQIANFEATIQNMVTNVEIRYWELHCGYRNLETAKAGRDAALETWRYINANNLAGTLALQDESQARGQYFTFRGLVEQAWGELLVAEGNLRYLLGVASTDGRLIRPIDEPTKARVAFDWCQSMDEALVYRPELRLERWEIQKKELALQYSKNSLLPTLDASALYRWLGLGDQYSNLDDNVPQFPQDGSGAVNELFDGNYSELEFSLDFGLPVGFRRELSNVRNAQLKLAQELARMEDMELDVSREMTQALQALEAQYQIAQTGYNSWASYADEVRARDLVFTVGKVPITFLLDAQQSRARSENQYYQAICEYNKLIALIHRRKGTILAYNNIYMNEGGWPEKAYDDASENARRRGASREINYGFTRPQVISLGEIYPTAGDTGGAPSGVVSPNQYWFENENPSFDIPEGEYYDMLPEQDNNIRQLEEIPGRSEPTPAGEPEILPVPGAVPPAHESPNTSQVQPKSTTAGSNVTQAHVDWNRFGFSRPDLDTNKTEAVIRQVNYEEPVDR